MFNPVALAAGPPEPRAVTVVGPESYMADGAGGASSNNKTGRLLCRERQRRKRGNDSDLREPPETRGISKGSEWFSFFRSPEPLIFFSKRKKRFWPFGGQPKNKLFKTYDPVFVPGTATPVRQIPV